VFQLDVPRHRVRRVRQEGLDLLGTNVLEGLLAKHVYVLLDHVPIIIGGSMVHRAWSFDQLFDLLILCHQLIL
jgi:hypothetical protein